MTNHKLEDISTENERYIITAPIVLKKFIRKNLEIMDFSEMYIQRSTQDYFIKFCESKITRKEVENQLSEMDGEIKMLTMEVEFLQGAWDICDDNELMQSRIGEYVIIHKIIKD